MSRLSINRHSKMNDRKSEVARKSRLSQAKNDKNYRNSKLIGESRTSINSKYSLSSKGSNKNHMAMVQDVKNPHTSHLSLSSIKSCNSRLLSKRSTAMAPIRTTRNGSHSNKYHPALKIRIDNNLSVESLDKNSNKTNSNLSNNFQMSKIDVSESADKLNTELRGILTHKQTW